MNVLYCIDTLSELCSEITCSIPEVEPCEFAYVRAVVVIFLDLNHCLVLVVEPEPIQLSSQIPVN